MKVEFMDYEIDTIELNLNIVESQIERYMNDIYAIEHANKSIEEIRRILNGKQRKRTTL